MSSMSLQASQPWTKTHEEDRRFRRILLQTLLISLVVGVTTPYIRIPMSDDMAAEELPPRRVRLLGDQLAPAPRPAAAEQAPAVAAPPTPGPLPARVPAPARPAVSPRQKAASSGVLTMRDQLQQLAARKPKSGTATVQEDVSGQAYPETAQPSALTANLTSGSEGIDGGVAHQSVLGSTGLPAREGSRSGHGSPDAGAAAGGRTAGTSPGAARSQEEIQEVLDRHKGAMYMLYNRELRRNPALQGRIVMNITIAPAGNVTRCVVLSSELDAASLEQQLVALIRGIDFGNKPDVPAVTTKVPIEFFPR